MRNRKNFSLTLLRAKTIKSAEKNEGYAMLSFLFNIPSSSSTTYSPKGPVCAPQVVKTAEKVDSVGKIFTREEIAKHATKNDAWIIIRWNVYNVSTFKHPGGPTFVSRYWGKDATAGFEAFHGDKAIEILNREYFIGNVATSVSGKLYSARLGS